MLTAEAMSEEERRFVVTRKAKRKSGLQMRKRRIQRQETEMTQRQTPAPLPGENWYEMFEQYFFPKKYIYNCFFLGFCPQVVFLLAVQGEDEGEKGAKGEERDHKV